ncbi:hypothetical protein LAZ67_2003174 [Cordylochernes scorpioides]|uniref:Retrovirus-related Pol polyprotein from type-1 retrotransposable element R1 n=1 Tax=Cordylochernes scorpioides TaxID=51811 RepID=A0ABY6K4A1_9ARAC|nr:hypothetical protein LAZ67_2003174 [Cordylochernes scorpioides]
MLRSVLVDEYLLARLRGLQTPRGFAFIDQAQHHLPRPQVQRRPWAQRLQADFAPHGRLPRPGQHPPPASAALSPRLGASVPDIRSPGEVSQLERGENNRRDPHGYEEWVRAGCNLDVPRVGLRHPGPKLSSVPDGLLAAATSLHRVVPLPVCRGGCGGTSRRPPQKALPSAKRGEAGLRYQPCFVKPRHYPSLGAPRASAWPRKRPRLRRRHRAAHQERRALLRGEKQQQQSLYLGPLALYRIRQFKRDGENTVVDLSTPPTGIQGEPKAPESSHERLTIAKIQLDVLLKNEKAFTIIVRTQKQDLEIENLIQALNHNGKMDRLITQLSDEQRMAFGNLASEPIALTGERTVPCKRSSRAPRILFGKLNELPNCSPEHARLRNPSPGNSAKLFSRGALRSASTFSRRRTSCPWTSRAGCDQGSPQSVCREELSPDRLYSDCMSALVAINLEKEQLAHQIIQELEMMTRAPELPWFRRHSLIEGNEFADRIAKAGCFRGRSLRTPVTKKEVYRRIRGHVQDLWLDRWRNSVKGREVFNGVTTPKYLCKEPEDEISLTTCGLVDPPFSENEVKLTAFKFGKRKSPGPEGIDNTVVKALVRMHPSLLSRLFNRCLDTGTFPEAWKVARVVLLERSGRKGNSPNDYRPLSLLVCLGMVLDSLLAQRLKHSLESNELLSPFQHGFREGKSITTALNEVLEGVEMGLNKGAWVLFVALDIDGAFNSMNWNKLMRNLMDMGCPDNLCSLVRDFLRERRISLSFGGRKLERNCARGCPQGSCCGPILWNILVNTVFQEELQEEARLVLYADDQFLIIEAASRAKAEKDQKVATTLERVQRTAALRITGGYRTTSSEAFLVLAGLIPLGLKLEEETIRQKIWKNREDALGLEAGALESKRDPRKPPQWLPKWNWSPGGPTGIGTEVFTDCSKSGTNTGAGVVIFTNGELIFQESLTLRVDELVFSAELVAIRVALRVCAEKNFSPDRLYSDCMSALVAINLEKGQLAHQIIQELEMMTRAPELPWFRRHSLIEGAYIPSGIVARSNLHPIPLTSPDTAITSIAICLEQSIIVVHSAYWHGLRAADDFIPLLEDTIRRTSLPVILGMDTNAHSPTWGIGARLDFRGANLEEFASFNDFHFLGPPVDSTWSNGPLSSSIDVTLASSSLAIHVTRGLLDEMAFTDHIPIWTTFLDMVNNETKSSWVESSCKEQTFKSFLNSSFHQEVSSAYWSDIHRFIARGRGSPRGPPLLKHDNGSLYNPHETCQTLLNHFFLPDTRPHPQRNAISAHSDEPEFKPWEVLRAIHRCGKRKAPGPDGLGSKCLDLGGPSLQFLLAELFTKCLRIGHFPRQWKEGRLILLPKSSNSATSQLEKYRPITLLNTMAKVFERCILARLQRLADRHGWFFEDQYKTVLGTVNGRSAEDELASITQLIEERQAHWRKTLVISSDISKAFDTVWRPAIIQNLERLNCSESITCLVKSFLKDRTVSYSAWTATECTSSQLGTPQGSAPSPFLWNIVARTIFTLPSIIDNRLIDYADDFTLMTQLDGASAWGGRALSSEGIRQLRSLHCNFAKRVLRGGPYIPTVSAISITGSPSFDIIVRSRTAFLKEINEGNFESRPGPASLPYPPDKRQLSFSLNIEEITTPIIFTDGSKNEAGVGAAIVPSSEDQQPVLLRLHPDCTAFQAELLAICWAVRLVKEGYSRNAITIASDCRSALSAICTSGPVRSTLVAKIILALNTNQNVNLCWVPGHCGIDGKERADRAAKNAAVLILEPSFSILPRSLARNHSRTATLDAWTEVYCQDHYNRHLRRIAHTPDRLLQFLPKVCPGEVTTTLLTGHGHVRADLVLWRLGEDPSCPH